MFLQLFDGLFSVLAKWFGWENHTHAACFVCDIWLIGASAVSLYQVVVILIKVRSEIYNERYL